MIKLCAFADEAGTTIEEQIEMLSKNHIPYFELRSIDGISVKDFTVEQAKGYAKKIEQAGLKVWSIGSPIGKVDITDNFDEYLNTFKHILEMAKIFNAKNIRMFSFFNAYDSKEKVMKRLQKLVDISKDYDVNLCHENEKDIYGDVLDRVLDIMANVKGLNYVYDPANFLQCGQDANDTIPALVDKVKYFHIKDVIVETEEIVPAGYGDGQIDRLVSLIKGDKVLSLEPHLKAFSAYDAIDNTEMKNKFHFTSLVDSFDYATESLKNILKNNGYTESKDEIGDYCWVK